MDEETTLTEMIRTASSKVRHTLTQVEVRSIGLQIRCAGMAVLRAGGSHTRMVEAHEAEIALVEECIGPASVEAASSRFCLASYLKKAARAAPQDEREALLSQVDAVFARSVKLMETQADGERLASALRDYASFLLNERDDAERGGPVLETLVELVKHDKAAQKAARYSLTSLKAQLAKLQGDGEGRVRAARTAVDETRRWVGPKHADYAVSVMNLGKLLSELGEYQEAKRALETAADVVRGRNEQVLGFVYRSMAELAEAESRFDEALAFLDAAELAWKRKSDAQNLDAFRARLVAARDAR